MSKSIIELMRADKWNTEATIGPYLEAIRIAKLIDAGGSIKELGPQYYAACGTIPATEHRRRFMGYGLDAMGLQVEAS